MRAALAAAPALALVSRAEQEQAAPVTDTGHPDLAPDFDGLAVE